MDVLRWKKIGAKITSSMTVIECGKYVRFNPMVNFAQRSLSKVEMIARFQFNIRVKAIHNFRLSAGVSLSCSRLFRFLVQSFLSLPPVLFVCHCLLGRNDYSLKQQYDCWRKNWWHINTSRCVLADICGQNVNGNISPGKCDFGEVNRANDKINMNNFGKIVFFLS